MASQTSGIVQNENINLPRGKGTEGIVPLKTEKKERKDRKALADISRSGKHLGSTTLKGSTKPKLSHGQQSTKKVPKNNILVVDEEKRLSEEAKASTSTDDKTKKCEEREKSNEGANATLLTDDEIKKCYEWAKDSTMTNEEMKKWYKWAKSINLTDEEIRKCFEFSKEPTGKVHFTSNDQQNHDKEATEKRVKKNVDMVMSCMSKWNLAFYDSVMPVKKFVAHIEDMKRLELEPVASLPVASSWPYSGIEEFEYAIPSETDIMWSFYDRTLDLKLKDE